MNDLSYCVTKPNGDPSCAMSGVGTIIETAVVLIGLALLVFVVGYWIHHHQRSHPRRTP